MDTPGPSAPVPDDQATHPAPPPAAHPGPPDEAGPGPSAPIAFGPVPGGWTPPPPLPPTPPGPAAGAGGAAWGPISTPYGLAWGPLPIPPAPVTSRRHPRLVPLIGAVVVISLLAGAGLGYAVRHPAGSSSANAAGNGGSPFGGGSGLFAPSNGGQGATTTPPGSGSSGPANASAIASKVDPGLVDINVVLGYQQESAAGTGQVLTSSGEVLTNNHVIDGATTISATDIGNGRTYTASVVGYDRTGDLAVIQLHGASGLSTVSIGDSSKVAVGEPIVAIGNAGGTGGTPSVAAGSVTTLDQAITASDDNGSNAETLTGLIEVNADVQPGDSGGPLVDSNGHVVGIDTAASQASFSSTAGQGFAIPINQAITIAKQIEAGKSSSTVHIGPTALLGVEIAPPGGDGLGGSSVAGADVARVAPGSPAEGVGLVAGDVITSAGGQTVTGPASLSSVIAAHSPGDSIPVVWVDANGVQHSASVKLASGPAT
ncbi:MAG TPA: trypsin-like peptidase domain-containing protein [Acidimicrobiales bacterium]|nr:trypsin-like peptidase domain-containing protein [Acidimicrobiales bacterium]